jgi:phthiocerol/phenolphthiocerol synthesis type-I polyketide synthase E
MALAGGVTIRASQKTGYLYREGSILSPDGHCRAFDEDAHGTVDGSGAGIVVLKRLDDAVADGDSISAIILGTAINNDGSSKVGFAAPSARAQTEVIVAAQSIAGVDADDITYIEAHGTGTPLGDLVEVEALTQAFLTSTARKQFCAIGSLKTNVGHLDTAAGVAGLIKSALSLSRKMIPPSVNFRRANPLIDFQNSPFYVNSELSPWSSNGKPRRAGVSSFGIGGTNAHLILEEASPVQMEKPSTACQLLVLSARSASALVQARANLAEHFKQKPACNLADVAYTLKVGRRHFNHRTFAVCRDVADAVRALEAGSTEATASNTLDGQDRPIIFMFPGQGSQYPSMGMELYEQEEVFRENVDLCLDSLEGGLSATLRRLLFTRSEDGQGGNLINQTGFTQPALFVIEYALAKLLADFGIIAGVMIGHSIGEYVAACLSGVFTLEDALRLVALRGALIQDLPPGSMMAVSQSEQELMPLAADRRLSLAAVNLPEMCVLAGPSPQIDDLYDELCGKGALCRKLRTSHAFHSEMMDPILEPIRGELKKIKMQPPQIRFISNLTGESVTASEVVTADYWVAHLRQTVQFGKGISGLLKEGNGIFVEVGPGHALTSLVRHHPDKTADHLFVPAMANKDSRDSELPELQKALGTIWRAGVALNWRSLHRNQTRRRVPLPTYPFQRERYWVEPNRSRDQKSLADTHVGRQDIGDWLYVPSWKRLPLLGQGFPPDKKQWLVFADETGLGARIAERLRSFEQNVVLVRKGASFEKHGEDSYAINPGARENYLGLIKDVCSRGRTLSGILHLWNVGAPDEPSALRPDVLLELAFYSPLYLFQSLGQEFAGSELRVALVSTGMHDVAGDEFLLPERALLLGPNNVVGREFPNISCRSIDLAEPSSSLASEVLIDQLIFELITNPPERVVAYRNMHRWVQTFEQIRADERENQPKAIKQSGAYLITGGCGGIGLSISEFLARTAKARLVLIGRTRFPDRSEWEAGARAQDELSDTIRKLLALEQQGSEVQVLAADVSDREQMKEAIEAAERRFGKIDGLIHAAGVAGGGIIQLRDSRDAARILAPKVQGTRVLESLFQGRKLDFFVLCSSLNSIVGGAGQVDYCAANAFLDAFAHYNTAKRLTQTTSINWPAWSEAGMAARYSSKAKNRRASSPRRDAESAPSEQNSPSGNAPGRLVVTSTISVKTHWELNEHRLAGRPLLPGTAYLDMVTAAFKDAVEGRVIEIEDLFFLRPIWVGEDEAKLLRIVFDEDDGKFNFSFRTKTQNGDGDANLWVEHAIGRVGSIPRQEPAIYDIDELSQRCNVRNIFNETGALPNGLGPRWASVKEIRIGVKERLARIVLPDEFVADLEKHNLHASLLDAATGFAKQYEQGLYLPLSYGRVRMLRPLSQRLFSYARQKESSDSRKETLAYDIRIMDEHGCELVNIEDFVVKRADDLEKMKVAAASISKPPSPGAIRSAGSGGSPLSPAHPPPGITPRDGVSLFSLIVESLPLPQVVVSSQELGRLLKPADPAEMLAIGRDGVKEAANTPSASTDLATSTSAQSEQVLMQIWQEVLGINRVGLHDNFFELGGDSVQAIQIAAQARKANLKLSVQELFEHQTIAELAESAKRTAEAAGRQADKTRSLPFSSYQKWLLEHFQTDSVSLNHVLLFKCQGEVSPNVLERALQILIDHNGSLRFRFIRDETGWSQFRDEASAQVLFEKVDLSHAFEADLHMAIAAKATELLQRGEAVPAQALRSVYFAARSEEQAHLLLLLNKLVCDETSVAIIMTQLEDVCAQLIDGETPALERNDAFAQWLEQSLNSREPNLAGDGLASGNSALEAARNTVVADQAAQAASDASGSALCFRLDAGETLSLREEIRQHHKSKPEEVILTALARAFKLEAGGSSLAVHITTSARGRSVADKGVSSAMGCFKEVFPVLLKLENDSKPVDSIREVKEQLRKTVGNGTPDLVTGARHKQSEVAELLPDLGCAQCIFNYSGVDLDLSTKRLFAPAEMQEISDLLPARNLRDLIEINATARKDELFFTWTYGGNVEKADLIEAIYRRFQSELRSLIECCRSADAVSYSPSDFPLAALDAEKLARVLLMLDENEAS